MIILYENIKKFRKQMNLSQEELAKRTGYTDRSSIAKIEKGLVDLTQTKIKQFADVFGITPSELMGWEREQQKNDAIADIVVKLRTDEELLHAVQVVCNADREKLSNILALLK